MKAHNVQQTNRIMRALDILTDECNALKLKINELETKPQPSNIIARDRRRHQIEHFQWLLDKAQRARNCITEFYGIPLNH